MTVNWIARSSPNISYAHFRTDLISFTAAIPLLAMSTFLEMISLDSNVGHVFSGSLRL